MSKEKLHISIVSPVYKAEKVLSSVVDRIEKSVSLITDNFEIILIEDCSPDNSWEIIEEITQRNKKVIGIKLSRNFGQHYAITAGLDHAIGDWIVVMDCDLQDQPEEISKLYHKAIEGFDVVLARRFNRKDTFIKKMFSRFFFKILGYLAGSDFDQTVANFGIYNKKVIKSICMMRENIRVFPIMVSWLGFNTAKIDVEHAYRYEGKSSYTFKKLVNLALDIILAYSDKPIRLIIKLGFVISISSFVFAALILYRYSIGDITVSGYTSLILSIWFLSGIIILILGVIGLYVGKTFEGVKERPIYVIDKIIK
jgi:glycosyltransferase involved in cell wall biosynthesis